MLRAVVVGTHKGTIELLQRRIGGVLKDIAKVDYCWYDNVEKTKADIYICYAYGVRIAKIKEMFKHTDKKVIGAELTLLPVGVRLLNSLPKGSKIGVISEHLRCANYFLSEIISSGVVDYNFIASPINEMKNLNVDYFVIPEELMDMINEGDIRKKIIKIPRTVTPMSAATIINVVLSRSY